MISVTGLRAGTTFQIDNQPYVVLKYEHKKMGRGTANIKVRVRDLSKGTVTEKTFVSGAQVQEITTTKRKLQYLYQQGDDFCFMEPKTYEQVSLKREILEEQAKFLAEGTLVDILFYEDTPLSLELPPKLEFMVFETGPGVKGNSATNIYKSATLQNGLTIKVPLFVKSGEKIMVDTRTGEYAERVK